MAPTPGAASTTIPRTGCQRGLHGLFEALMPRSVTHYSKIFEALMLFLCYSKLLSRSPVFFMLFEALMHGSGIYLRLGTQHRSDHHPPQHLSLPPSLQHTSLPISASVEPNQLPTPTKFEPSKLYGHSLGCPCVLLGAGRPLYHNNVLDPAFDNYRSAV